MTATLASRRIATEAPALSVVIASVNGWDVLGPTLASLDALPERDRIEVVVVEAVGGETRDRLLAHRPAVTVIPIDEKRPIPRLRYVGVQQASGDLIAILEDHGEVGSDWADTFLELHKDGTWGAVGGSVENGTPGLINWAVFFCEYAGYMGPVVEGITTDLPGNNICYKREHLCRHAHLLDEGNWESWINDRLIAEGVPMASTNRSPVRHIKAFRLGYFLVQRFHFSRSYAGMRRAAQSPLKRLAYAAGSIILPGLLLVRAIRQAVSKRRDLGLFTMCVPLLALFFTVGALGESVGYLLGAGDSLERVE